MSGVELIAKEREEQIEVHGCSIEYDCANNFEGQLVYAAHVLLEGNDEERLGYEVPVGWGEVLWDKMLRKNYRDRLVMAGALIAAELDRRLKILILEKHEKLS